MLVAELLRQWERVGHDRCHDPADPANLVQTWVYRRVPKIKRHGACGVGIRTVR